MTEVANEGPKFASTRGFGHETVRAVKVPARPQPATDGKDELALLEEEHAGLAKFSKEEMMEVSFAEIRINQTYWLAVKNDQYVEFVKEDEVKGRRVTESNGGHRCAHREVTGLFLKRVT